MGTVVGTWRLKLILILVIFSTAVYLASAMFSDLGGTVNDEGYITYANESIDLEYNQTTKGVEKGQSFLNVLGGLGNFLTFGSIDNPWARLFFSGIMGIVGITIGYVVYTFVKEWIPLT